MRFITFSLFLFFGSYAFADCTTSLVSDPELGSVYFKVHRENTDKPVIFLEALKEDGSQRAFYKGHPVKENKFSNGREWIAQSVYRIDEKGHEIELEAAHLGLLKFDGTPWIELLFSLSGGIAEPAICN